MVFDVEMRKERPYLQLEREEKTVHLPVDHLAFLDIYVALQPHPFPAFPNLPQKHKPNTQVTGPSLTLHHNERFPAIWLPAHLGLQRKRYASTRPSIPIPFDPNFSSASFSSASSNKPSTVAGPAHASARSTCPQAAPPRPSLIVGAKSAKIVEIFGPAAFRPASPSSPPPQALAPRRELPSRVPLLGSLREAKSKLRKKTETKMKELRGSKARTLERRKNLETTLTMTNSKASALALACSTRIQRVSFGKLLAKAGY